MTLLVRNPTEAGNRKIKCELWVVQADEASALRELAEFLFVVKSGIVFACAMV